MSTANKIKIIYIAGNGHSGSTLLDIMLGSIPQAFSAGELTFVTRKSIFDEYCSCGEQIKDCAIWTQIIAQWLANSPISYEEHCQLRLRFESNKASLRSLKNCFYSSRAFQKYVLSTRCLFEAIQQVTGVDTIIDSSKSPQRIAVLRKVGDLRVVHLCRNFTGVLNSGKSSSKKDMKAGIEADNPEKPTHRVVFNWILINILSSIFCLFVSSVKIKYKAFIQTPETLDKIDPIFKNITQYAPYHASHMLAGNKIRLQGKLKIDQNLGFTYGRLTESQKKLGKLIEIFFWYWC